MVFLEESKSLAIDVKYEFNESQISLEFVI